MLGQVQTLRKEHANFERLLDLLERRLVSAGTTEEPDFKLMLDVMEYMTHYPDRFHHPREDLAFRRLQRKFPETRPLVEELAHQHEAIAASGEHLVEQLTRAAEGIRLSREAVEACARAYIAALRANMRIEETDLFPLVAERLQADDWLLIDAAFHFMEDPIFGSAVQERYRALHRHIAWRLGCGCTDDVA